MYCTQNSFLLMHAHACRLYFFGYQQVDGDLLNLFKQLSQNELQVIVFHGTVQRYFDLLLEASRYSFVGPE